MKNIIQELAEIWETESFINGQKYFFLYNYKIFRFVEKEEFKEFNEKLIHLNKNIFAVADRTNGDNEHEAYLYFNTETNHEIFIQSNYHWCEPKELRKISDELTQLFGTQNYTKKLMTKNDNDFWTWYEESFQSYKIEENVPNGVIPDFDLRNYFKEKLKDTFLTDYEEFDTNAFKCYFENFGFFNLDFGNLFESKLSINSLSELVNKLNTQLNDKVFYVASFVSFGFLGIGNYKSLSIEETDKLYRYGIIN